MDQSHWFDFWRIAAGERSLPAQSRLESLDLQRDEKSVVASREHQQAQPKQSENRFPRSTGSFARSNAPSIGFSVSLKATCLLRLFRILLRMKRLTHMPCGGTQRMFGVPVAFLKCIASTVLRNRNSHVRGASCFGEG